ncbi:MAG: hypothetical protein P4M04_05320 [Acidobacteriota bacterium]|nr:hypothetical protein [Acidobacteriota bacterium]
MDIHIILADLKKEADRIAKAISALEGIGSSAPRRGRPVGSKSAPKRRHMSAAARKRISEMMKLRWAERKKKSKQ